MKLTEEQARKTWCWRAMASQYLVKCEASDCMAWRWVYTDGWTNIKTGETSIGEQMDTGYCGLTGKPHD